MKRKQRQDALSKRKNEETYKRLTAKNGEDDGEKNHMRSVTKAACYQNIASVPPRKNMLISIDTNAEALLIPVMGMLIPIHIMTVKSIIYSQVRTVNCEL
jgi:nucleosome binding factor SPN SPT16 subunit